MSIRFSVVIPLFDKQAFIGETIRSVLAQEHPPLEVLVVDDASTDGSRDAVRAIEDPRIRLIEQENAGPGPARNRGIAEARGEWIALLDADDLWLPDHLATLAQLAGSFPSADAVAASFWRGDPAAFPGAASGAQAHSALLDYFVETSRRETICSSTIAIRRTLFEELGGFGAFRPGEDLEMWARLALDHAIALSGKVTVIYRMDTGGLMDSWEAQPDPRFELQPIFSTLANALASDRYRDKHAGIRRYRNALLERNARHALYRGQRRNARRFLDELRKGGEHAPPLLRLLSLLPGPVARRAGRLFSAAKRAIRR